MRIGWLFLLIFLTASQAQLMLRRLAREELRAEARTELSRLANVTLKVYQGGRPPVDGTFWKEIGRTEPIFDPWGKPYVLESPAPGQFVWRSSGPDGGYGTDDDFTALIPQGSGVDLSSPELERKSAPVTTAE